MSISKAQAKLIADGLLDSLGASKDDFRPVNTYGEIIMLAGELVEDAQNNLNNNHNIASGKLSASVAVADPVQNGTIMRADILMLEYGRFVNRGVKGTKGGKGQYSFKNDFVPKKMVESIQIWIKRAERQVKNTSNKTTYGLEKKRIGISQLNKGRSIAYAVARSIKQKGIAPTGFLDKAIISTQQKVRERLGSVLKIDIINALS